MTIAGPANNLSESTGAAVASTIYTSLGVRVFGTRGPGARSGLDTRMPPGLPGTAPVTIVPTDRRAPLRDQQIDWNAVRAAEAYPVAEKSGSARRTS